MKWLALPFIVLLVVPVAQVGGDVWQGRSGPTLCLPHRCLNNAADTSSTKRHQHDRKIINDEPPRNPQRLEIG